ncbi:hypothetical protein MES5069_100017 [Mesorhizobium escarrei]|uniref:Uncharacterized protein n=1 Tax=Mesorhizobium escarrei TaxID=666018 RepID=A0ABM9DHA1_9HYPH|nr:hypothetical protein MES5069_100017 [Mesorhizobium escarrei]
MALGMNAISPQHTYVTDVHGFSIILLFVAHVAVVARPIPLYIAVIWRTLLTNADRLVGRAIPSGCWPTLAGASSDRLQDQ